MGIKHDAKIAQLVGKPLSSKFEFEAAKIVESNNRVGVRLESIERKFDIMAEDLNARLLEKSGISLPKDIQKMDETEKTIVVCILRTLYELSPNPTSYQRDFWLSIKKRLEVTHRQVCGVDISKAIDAIKDVDDQRAVLYVVCSFLFLETLDHRYLDEYKDVISSFCVRGEDIKEAVIDVEWAYQNMGIDGMVTDYGPAKEYDKAEPKKEPRSLSIALIFNKKDKPNARVGDILKTALEVSGNQCKLFSFKEDEKGILGSYIKKIYIGNNDHSKKVLDTGKVKNVIDEYGCFIGRTELSPEIFVIYNDPKYNFNTCREEFISFINDTICDNESAKRLNKFVEKRERKKPNYQENWATDTAFPAVSDFFGNGLDKLGESDKLFMKILTCIYGIVGVVVMIPTGILTLLGMGGELLGKALIEKLNDTSFDIKYVAAAQEQVLIQKVAQMIFEEQCE